MRRTIWVASALILALSLSLGGGYSVLAATQAAQPAQKPGYTMPEYNAYVAAKNETNPQIKVKLLDDFTAKYPNSELLIYAYRDYYLAYSQLRDFPKMATYADKMVALGDKVDAFSRMEALTARAQAFYLGQNLPAFQTPDQLRLAASSAKDGLASLEKWQKPEQMNEEQFAQQKQSLTILFYSVHGIAALQAKDLSGAVASFEVLHKLQPKDAVNLYRLGRAYLSMEPPNYMDGFWHLAQAIGLKVQGEQQIRTYLRAQLLRYQALVCDSLVDGEMNRLLETAMQSEDRPASFVIPSAEQFQKIREETAASFISELKAGGDRGPLVFKAYCGLEFPEVGGKLIAVESGNESIVLKLFIGATPEETDAGTEANMTVKVEGQPEAKRITTETVAGLRFSGTLSGYDAAPFMLHWTKAKVNPEDIPEEAAPGKAAKRPTKRPPR
jgi:hypothetical protein